MKKLMIAAATAAMIGGAFADGVAQVYDVSISGKTTQAKTGKVTKNPFVTKGTKITYRQQGSFKWTGIIWGCGCDTINGEWKVVNQTHGTVGGCAVWDAKTYAVVYLGRNTGTGVDSWGWDFLNAINLNADGVEGLWAINGTKEGCDGNTLNYAFAGAGFGSSKNAATCDGYISSISGNVAGYNCNSYDTKSSTCWFCDDDAYCNETEAWEFCDTCIDNALMNADKTAVSATWSIKYNSSLSKKLEKNEGQTITAVYSFPKKSLIAEAILAKEDFIRAGGYDCEEEEQALSDAEAALEVAEAAYDKAADKVDRAQEKYDDAETALADAEKALEESSDAALYTAYTNAQAAINKAAEEDAAAMRAIDESNRVYDVAYDGYTNATLLATGSVWKVTYTANLNEFTETVTNCVAFDEKVGALVKDYAKITNVVYIAADTGNPTKWDDYKEALAQSTSLQTAAKNASDALDAANAGVEAAKDAKKLTEEAEAAAREARDTAKYNYDYRAVYQQIASANVKSAEAELRERAEDLEDAEAAAETAQEAVDAAQEKVDAAQEALDCCEDPELCAEEE